MSSSKTLNNSPNRSAVVLGMKMRRRIQNPGFRIWIDVCIVKGENVKEWKSPADLWWFWLVILNQKLTQTLISLPSLPPLQTQLARDTLEKFKRDREYVSRSAKPWATYTIKVLSIHPSKFKKIDNLTPRIGNSSCCCCCCCCSCSVLVTKDLDGHISGTKRPTGDLLVSKRLDFLGLFRFSKIEFLEFCIFLDFWPYLGNEKSYRRSAGAKTT